MTRAYLLPPDQLTRVFEAGGPLVDMQVTPERLAQMRVAVVEVDDRIVAYWVVWAAIHVEPLWIQPAHRLNPVVVEGIIDAMHAAVAETEQPVAFCEIATENLEVVGGYAQRLGFQEAPGKLYYLVVPASTREVKE